jgi:hypothetical protein
MSPRASLPSQGESYAGENTERLFLAHLKDIYFAGRRTGLPLSLRQSRLGACSDARARMFSVRALPYLLRLRLRSRTLLAKRHATHQLSNVILTLSKSRLAARDLMIPLIASGRTDGRTPGVSRTPLRSEARSRTHSLTTPGSRSHVRSCFTAGGGCADCRPWDGSRSI